MSGTPRLSLPFLNPGQAQKEFFVNESLQTLDVLVAGAVDETRSTPPATPAPGAAYIVGTSPAGEWAERSQCIAAFTDGGWRFVAPAEGMRIYVKAAETIAVFRAGAWEVGTVRCSQVIVGGQKVVGARGAAIASAAGGSTVDVEARAAIEGILDRLRAHGLIGA
nr:DUF2793 domain-containing protein [Sphingomonas sp.]